ncbi:hypothetical protein DNK48_30130 [Streptomyces malaysiensis subsp. malaysiensis]|nr:hypothetical protein DNK48_30130 [Streptomyces malaysiensis]
MLPFRRAPPFGVPRRPPPPSAPSPCSPRAFRRGQTGPPAPTVRHARMAIRLTHGVPHMTNGSKPTCLAPTSQGRKRSSGRASSRWTRTRSNWT